MRTNVRSSRGSTIVLVIGMVHDWATPIATRDIYQRLYNLYYKVYLKWKKPVLMLEIED